VICLRTRKTCVKFCPARQVSPFQRRIRSTTMMSLDMTKYREMTKEERREYHHEWREKNREVKRAYGREWRKKNKIEAIAKEREYRARNREHLRKYRHEYYLANKEAKLERQRDYDRKRRQTDLNYRLSGILRGRLYKALKSDQKVGSAIDDLCCSIDELKQWLEDQFKPGMTWDNYGEWQIDHIFPLSKADLTDRKQFKKVCHWFNLQPLWTEENQEKGAKV